MGKNGDPELVKRILQRLLDKQARPTPDAAPEVPEPEDPMPRDGTSCYDFDLAEFPLFRLYKNAKPGQGREPLRYADKITGQGGVKVSREWAVYPGPFGFGGQSAQVLLFDLLQLYAEQGARGSQIQFGTLRSLLLRRGERHPSARDYERVRRDIDVLRGYDLHCKNAFWDARRKAYVDMNWRLFGSVFYFKNRPDLDGDDLPFGFIEVSPVFQQVARTRGFLALGFDRFAFYALRPLEQRLSLYLAKHFTSQKLHRRFVADLVRVLPMEAKRERAARAILTDAAEGLVEKRLPILSEFKLERSRAGDWLASFTRGKAPDSKYVVPAAESLTPAVADLVRRIAEATGNANDRVWWAQCAERLGPGAVDRALGQLKEVRAAGRLRNPGGLLTKIFKDLAEEQGIVLH